MSGTSTSVKTMIFSPVAVLMSWCKLRTWTPVDAWTIASKTGRASSISWVRTCFQQISSLFRNECFDQVLLGGGQHATKSNDEQITVQMGLNVLGATAHLFQFEVCDPLTDCRFDFASRFHRSLQGSLYATVRGIPNRFKKDSREPSSGLMAEPMTTLLLESHCRISYQSRNLDGISESPLLFAGKPIY